MFEKANIIDDFSPEQEESNELKDPIFADIESSLHAAQTASSLEQQRSCYINCIRIIKKLFILEKIEAKGGLPSEDEINKYDTEDEFEQLWGKIYSNFRKEDNIQ